MMIARGRSTVPVLPLLIGAGVAVITGALTLKISRSRASVFYSAFMAATAAVYVGSALAGGDTSILGSRKQPAATV